MIPLPVFGGAGFFCKTEFAKVCKKFSGNLFLFFENML